jgi:poly(3-hydroxybutyrate) depolymerase
MLMCGGGVAVPASMLLFCVASELPPGAKRTDIVVESSVDGTEQPSYLIVPADYRSEGPPAPLLVSLHSWSYGVEQRNEARERAALARGWLYLFPHFRGANKSPEACGSPQAQQDILDAVDWVVERYNVDRRRIYLAGSSGGGYMTMLMAGRHPEVWAAASAWVGISDLAAWHELRAKDGYGKMLRACCGGAPGDSPEVDAEYRERSPLTHLHRAAGVALDLNAGVHDGHRGSVPIRHTLSAFNAIARACGAEPITEEEIAQLSRPNGRLDRPRPSDQVEDPILGRAIYLRRTAGQARVTIFEGGHEGLVEPTIEWLARHVKPGDESQ